MTDDASISASSSQAPQPPAGKRAEPGQQALSAGDPNPDHSSRFTTLKEWVVERETTIWTWAAIAGLVLTITSLSSAWPWYWSALTVGIAYSTILKAFSAQSASVLQGQTENFNKVTREATRQLAVASECLNSAKTNLARTQECLANTIPQLAEATVEVNTSAKTAYLAKATEGPDFRPPITMLVREMLRSQDHGRFPPLFEYTSTTQLRFLKGSDADLEQRLKSGTAGGPPVTWAIIRQAVTATVLDLDELAPLIAGLVKPKVVMTEKAFGELNPFMSPHWDAYFPIWPDFERKFVRQWPTREFRTLPWLNPLGDDCQPRIQFTFRDSDRADVNNNPNQRVPTVQFADMLHTKLDRDCGIVKRRELLRNEVFEPARKAHDNDVTWPEISDAQLDGILAVSAPTIDPSGVYEPFRNGASRLELKHSYDYLIPLRFDEDLETRSFLDRYVLPIDRVAKGATLTFKIGSEAPIEFSSKRPPYTPLRLGVRSKGQSILGEMDVTSLERGEWTISLDPSSWLIPGDAVILYYNWSDLVH